MFWLLLACAPKVPDFDAWRFAPYPGIVVPTGGPSSAPSAIPDPVFAPGSGGATNLADSSWTLDDGSVVVLRGDGVAILDGVEGRWSQAGQRVWIEVGGRQLEGAVQGQQLAGSGWSAQPTPPPPPPPEETPEETPETPDDGG